VTGHLLLRLPKCLLPRDLYCHGIMARNSSDTLPVPFNFS
jgi:hypothetical protein